MLFSDAIKDHDTETQRRLYSLFTRASSQGDIPALKLLDKMTVISRDGKAREVQDFFLPDSAAEQLGEWVSRNATKRNGGKSGITAQEASQMTEAELLALIQKKQAPKKPRKTRARKSETGS